jgi:hypothetical protein
MEDKKPVMKINLVQPNKVTNARHDFDERQENILTLMIEAIQNHMSKVEFIQTDLFGQPMIAIDFAANGLNKAKYWESAKKMRSKDFEFEYTNQDGFNEEVAGVLITTVRKIEGKSRIELTINQWAIPYLLYWGKGVGGTVFNKVIALTIRGEYPKRMYKLCKRWEDRGGFSMPIKEFRQMMMLEDSYEGNKNLKTLLKRCQVAMMETADIYFNFTMEKKGGSRSYNLLNFKIEGNNKNKPKQQKTDMYVSVYNTLTLVYPVIKSSNAQEISDKLASDPQKLEDFYRRTRKLLRELDEGDKSVSDIIKLVRYILKTDYGIG